MVLGFSLWLFHAVFSALDGQGLNSYQIGEGSSDDYTRR